MSVEFNLDFYNFIGLAGTTLYLASYFLLVINKVKGNGAVYISANGLAAAFVCFSLFEHWNLPSFIIQSCWITISLVGLFKIFYRHKLEDKAA